MNVTTKYINWERPKIKNRVIDWPLTIAIRTRRLRNKINLIEPLEQLDFINTIDRANALVRVAIFCNITDWRNYIDEDKIIFVY